MIFDHKHWVLGTCTFPSVLRFGFLKALGTGDPVQGTSSFPSVPSSVFLRAPSTGYWALVLVRRPVLFPSLE